jgi:hypothetical protein
VAAVLDTGGNGLVVANETAVNRMDLADCESFTTCSTCVAAPSVYCGWCPLAAACTTRQECADPVVFDRSDALFSP